MKLSYFLLLVTVIFTVCSANVATSEVTTKLKDQSTEVAVNDNTHRYLKGSKKSTTENTLVVSEERLAIPGVESAVNKLKSMLNKNPTLANALKPKTPGVGINLSNPAIRKEMKIVAGLLTFIIGVPLVAVGISRVTRA